MSTGRHARVAMLLVAALGTACAHSGAAAVSPNEAVITAAELDSAGTASVYDVIARGHALFLRNRGRTSIYGDTSPRAVVFIGETEYGDLETLRNQPASRFGMVRYYSGTEAASKFGSRYSGGVIQLVPRVE
jgi:hypothetical protein